MLADSAHAHPAKRESSCSALESANDSAWRESTSLFLYLLSQ